MRSMFLAGARLVLETIDDPVVEAAWGSPTVLDHQDMGSLVSHLARGSVWVVDEYLDRPVPDDPLDYDSAGHYHAGVADTLTDDLHAEVRARSAALAAEGWGHVVGTLRDRIDRLQDRLATEPADRHIVVFGGKVMRLDDYLHTRIVEQVVHLDDLARSLDRPTPRFAPGTVQLTIAAAMEIGRRRHGDVALMRALFRDPASGVLPILA